MNPEHSIPYYIRAAFRGFETALSRYLATIDLPVSHFYILRLDWTELGRQQSEIARKSSMTESVASQVIQKMEKTGLVKRKTDPQDARKRRVYITDKGKDLRRKVITHGIKITQENGPNISAEDAKIAISVLIKIKEGFDMYNTEIVPK